MKKDDSHILDEIGMMISNRYVIVDHIGSGGMAEIYRAKMFGAAGFEKEFAVKLIRPQFLDEVEFIEMFVNEAKLTVALYHTNIVQVFDFGQHEDRYYIVMEYVEGKDLLDVLARCVNHNVHMPLDISLHIGMEILKGLDFAHHASDPSTGESLNLIHRDVSPSNVLISYNGEVKLGDFGVAKARTKRNYTQTGTLKGKVGYMSPEQVTGEGVDYRTDIFAAGIVLFEMLTMTRLFKAETEFATMVAIRDCDIDKALQRSRPIPQQLANIVKKALHKDPEQRFQSAGEFFQELSAFCYTYRLFIDNSKLSNVMRRLFAKDIQQHKRKKIDEQKLFQLSSALRGRGDGTPDALSAQHTTFSPPSKIRPTADVDLPLPEIPSMESASGGKSSGRDDFYVENFDANLSLPKSISSHNERGDVTVGSPSIDVKIQEAFNDTQIDGSLNHVSAEDLFEIESHKPPTSDPMTSFEVLASKKAFGSFVQKHYVYPFYVKTEKTEQGPIPANQVLNALKYYKNGQISFDRIKWFGVTQFKAYLVRHFRHSMKVQSVGSESSTQKLISQGQTQKFDDAHEVKDLFDENSEVNQSLSSETTFSDKSPDDREKMFREGSLSAARRAEKYSKREIKSGTFSEISVPRLLFRIVQSRETGRLSITTRTFSVELHFIDGHPVSLLTDLESKRLGELLLEQKLISKDQLLLALKRMKERGGRLGDALVAIDAISATECMRYVNTQFEEKFLDLFQIHQGAYTFYENQMIANRPYGLTVNVKHLIALGCLNRISIESIMDTYRDRHDERFFLDQSNIDNIFTFELNRREASILNHFKSGETLEILMQRLPQEARHTAYRLFYLLHQVEHLYFEENQAMESPGSLS